MNIHCCDSDSDTVLCNKRYYLHSTSTIASLSITHRVQNGLIVRANTTDALKFLIANQWENEEERNRFTLQRNYSVVQSIQVLSSLTDCLIHISHIMFTFFLLCMKCVWLNDKNMEMSVAWKNLVQLRKHCAFPMSKLPLQEKFHYQNTDGIDVNYYRHKKK